ncbi:MAG: T9SS type A sorting domain-containing protein [Chitinophagaceae bacterium]|jgi:hypothetical protein
MKKLYLLVLLLQFFVSASAQTLDWAHSFACETACPTISSSTGYGITYDKAGNSYTTGTFNISLDADPGPGTYTLSSSSATAYIIKLNSTGGFVWAVAFESSDLCLPHEIVLDDSGNVYTTGAFRGDCDFDPGSSTHILTAPTYPKSSSFISKLDTGGKFVWVNVIGNGTDRADGYNIKIDKKGDIVTSGIFSGKVDFDPGPGSATYSASITDAYLCKFDKGGNLVWANQLQGSYVSYCGGLDIDNDNQIYLGGSFDGTVDFDPGPLVNFITSVDEYDLFITKFTSAGELIWAKTIGDIYLDNFSTLVVDKQSNIYCTGTFIGKLDFDPGTGTYFQTATSTDGSDFLLKLDKDGVFKWAQVYDFSNQYSSLVTTDTAGNIYTTGSFKKSFDFDFGTGAHILTPKGSISDIYMCKYNSDGELKWATQISGKKNPGKMYKISVDPTGGIFTAGVLNDSADFDPGPGSLLLNKRNLLGDAFAVKMHNCVIDINRTITKSGSLLTSNENDGLTYQWIDCATKTAIPGAASKSYTPVKSGSYAIAITKQYCSDTAYCFDYIPTEFEEFDFSDRITLTPNPSKGAITIQLSKKYSKTIVEVKNIIGQNIYSHQFLESDQIAFDFTCPAGIYLVTVKTSEGTSKTFKIIRE